MSPKMTRADRLWHIWYLLNRDRKQARADYLELFERPVTDYRIEDELHHLILEHEDRVGGEFPNNEGSDRIAVPPELLFAIILRPRGPRGGKGKPPLELAKRLKRDGAIRDASIEWAKRVKNKGRKVSKEAKEAAAAEVAERSGISKETIEENMSLAQGNRYLESKVPKKN